MPSPDPTTLYPSVQPADTTITPTTRDSCLHPPASQFWVHQAPDLGWNICYNCGATGRVVAVHDDKLKIAGGRLR
jgi:hypothetical protein